MKPVGFLPLGLLAGLVAACGNTSSSTAQKTTPTPPGPAGNAAAPGPLEGEAASAAAGDIPDNQVFITFRDRRSGWSMVYPEGWAERRAASSVTFRDKNNIVRVEVAAGRAATLASVRADMAALKRASRSVESGKPGAVTVSGRPGIKVVYRTTSEPNAVTGKRVALVVDRYYLSDTSRRAVVDLGTPVGVDNVDAYRQMIDSFRWR